MVFETSCWVSSTCGFNNNYNNCTNPIERRTQIDIFDTSMVNATSVISHISSNGYYGYCPTMQSAVTSTQTAQSSAGTVIMPANSQITAAVVHSNNADESNMDVTNDAAMCETNNVQQLIQGQHAMHENRKRQCNSDIVYVDDAKRRRNGRNIDVHDGMCAAESI